MKRSSLASQGSIAETRLSLGLDADLSVATMCHHLPMPVQCQPTSQLSSCPKALTQNLQSYQFPLEANQAQTALSGPLSPLLALSRPCPRSHFPCRLILTLTSRAAILIPDAGVVNPDHRCCHLPGPLHCCVGLRGKFHFSADSGLIPGDTPQKLGRCLGSLNKNLPTR